MDRCIYKCLGSRLFLISYVEINLQRHTYVYSERLTSKIKDFGMKTWFGRLMTNSWNMKKKFEKEGR